MKSLISVIVPIYNVELYLPQCIDSIVNQTYKNLEIILVDDGSPDRCPQICDEYAAKDKRIKVIHQQNGGLSAARNAGLDIATGEYIAFVDSDDWVDIQMYEHLMFLITKHKADVSTCAVCKVVDDIKTKPIPPNLTETLYRGNDLFDKLFDDSYNVRSEVWNKIYSRHVLRDLKFKDGQIYEDLYFDRILYSTNCLVAVSNYPLYYYRVNREGSTNSFFKRNRFAMFEELDDFIDMFKKQNRNNLVDLYECFALEAATDFYCQARGLKADKIIVEEILSKFDKYYKFSEHNLLIRRRGKYRLFQICPKAYYYLRKFYSLYLSLLRKKYPL